ncbi:MAG: uroporphyrinogen decarboxylase family protein [Phycisphaerae bacterium]|jgi:uroporphyrinogen-III decarboxylase
MSRPFFLDLAASGHRAPIGTHLVLHTRSDADAILLDGARLGGVVAETAERFRTPLAIPLMDLTLEKASLLGAMGIPAEEVDAFHFEQPPNPSGVFQITPRMRATCDAISHVASQTSLVPVGMGIGPFSLMTKLVKDPITPVFLAGSGMTGEEEPEVAVVEKCLEAGIELILSYLSAQADAGAKAIIVCEPAANLVYFSPNQLAEGFEIFDRYVMSPMRRIKSLLEDRGVDLIFHDCGELTNEMVARFSTLDPAMMSLGCSRRLWEDAALVPKTTVLYGNLPTKKFYSPQLTVADVEVLSGELLEKMRASGHPFILGSECDVLSVPGSEKEILAKVDAFMRVP